MTTIEHVHWFAKPALKNPTILAAFTGWNDAAEAASTAIRNLIEAWGAVSLAEIDPEPFTDYASVRPQVRLNKGKRRIIWPSVGLWHVSWLGKDIILVLGPEPSLRWRLFSNQIFSIAEHFNSQLLVTLGSLLADVPHSRPVQIIGTATDNELIERFDLQRSRYEGPTGIIGILHDSSVDSAILSASLWAAVPAYASQIPSPKASLALMRRTCEMIGTFTPLSKMANLVENYEQQVDSLVKDDDDLVAYVERLEHYTDEGISMGDDVDERQLRLDFEDHSNESEMSGEADVGGLVDEVEQFLRDQNGKE